MRAQGQVDSGPTADRRADRGWDLLLAAAVAVQAAAMTAWPRVVTVDGPAHLAGAAALLEAGSGPHAVYLTDLSPVPNMLTTLVLAALLGVTGPDTAERLLVLAYAVGLPLAARYALRGLHPRAGWLALAVVPFAGGYLSAYGFYNFCLALVGFLAVVGLGLRQRSGWSWRSTAAVAVLLGVTWSAHLLPTVVAGLTLAVLALARATAARAGGRGAAGWRSALTRHVLPVALAGLPVLVLTLRFAVESSESRGEPVRTSSVAGLVGGLLTLGRPLVAWTTWEYAGSALVAAGILAAVLAAVARPARGAGRSPERLGLVAAALLLTAWYLASPDRYGHEYGFLNDRLSHFPPLLAVLAAAGPPPALRRAGGPAAGDRAVGPAAGDRAVGPAAGDRAGRAAVVLLLVGTLALVGLRLPTEVRYQRDVAELLSVADAVPVGSTLVGLRLWRDAPVGPDARNRARDPLRHAPGRIAVLRDAVNVGHYEASTPYFPVRFRPESDPRRAIDPDLGGLELVPPQVDLTRGPEVVLLVGRARAEPEALADPAARRLLGQLEAAYRPVAVSEPTGLVEVWERR